MSEIVTLNLDEVSQEIRKAEGESITEQDLSIRINEIFKRLILNPLGLPLGRYEYSPKKYSTLISGVRIDALHAHVIIEYEKPKSFESAKNFQHALQQVKDQIIAHAGGNQDLFDKYFGIVIDGSKIGFVRFRQRLQGFDVSRESLRVNRNTIGRLVEAIVGLKRKALDAAELVKDFGPGSNLARVVLQEFYSKLSGKTSERTLILFRDWKRVFSQVCAYDPDKLENLEFEYGIEGKAIDEERLFFALHSYFALLMKLLAAEVSSLYWPITGSFLKALEDSYLRGHLYLKQQLVDLEQGGIFAKLGISNFLEGDYFSWYVDEWDAQLSEKITVLVKKLSDYDPSTADLEPDRIKDLFKQLYQNLVPKRIRHDLGEYYTPDWLAELLLDHAGFSVLNFEKIARNSNDKSSPLNLRFLDPACGSGTFLVSAVKRLRNYIDENWIDRSIALGQMTRNIVGFDLNPLAVMASRTNYLIAIGDILRERGSQPLEIPIYLADSISLERKPTVLGTSTYSLRTTVGEFLIPIETVEENRLGKVLSLMEECLHKPSFNPKEFRSRISKEIELGENETFALVSLYETLLRLENESKNGIWLRILKNSFAPLLVPRFDFVIGNPPWVNWESLPEDYRDSTKDLWEKYNLFTLHGHEARLGGGKKDIAMLFTYVSADKYLKDNGTLGFVITQSVFKTKGAADGFRGFRLKDSELGIIEVHDLVRLKPFEGASNRTTFFILKKGVATKYPVSYVLWKRFKGGSIGPADSLEEIRSKTKTYDLLARPITQSISSSPWFNALPGNLTAVSKILGKSYYKGYEGANTGGANGVFWVEVLQHVGSEYVLIANNFDSGKRKFRSVRAQIERALLYPLLRGRDISKWKARCSTNIILAQDPEKRLGIPVSRMKRDFPKTLRYLEQFRDELLGRKSSSIEKDPFYSMFGIGTYTIEKWKVVWAREASMLEASVCGLEKDAVSGHRETVPDQTVMFIPTKSEMEAHYICALLNSSPITLVPLAYTLDITTHLLSTVNIPQFDKSNRAHLRLAELSKSAHNKENPDYTLIQNEIDNVVCSIYGLSKKELTAMKECFRLLSN